MISNIHTSEIIQNDKHKSAESTVSCDFLSITSRFTKSNMNSWISLSKDELDNVYTGLVQEEIDKVLKEEEQISQIMKKNTNEEHPFVNVMPGNAPKSGEIGTFVSSSTQNLSSKTDTTNIKNCVIGDATQKQVIYDAIDMMVGWLDDLIANYDARSTAGKAAGQQEVKLTVLLQLRNNIKNCDFPIGVGESSLGDDVGGQYSSSYLTDNYDNIEFQGQKIDYYRQIYDHHFNRSIMFPPSQIYSGAEFSTAAILIHELVHAMHIRNECVTYLIEEVFADDMGVELAYGEEGKVLRTNQDVIDFGNWWEQTSQERQDPSYVTDEVGNKKEFDNFSLYS